MTTEPRQEAEYIVNRVAGIGAMGALGIPAAAGERPSEFTDRVKDALAAAIKTVEHYTNGSAYMERVLDEQVAALSALREDETWHAS